MAQTSDTQQDTTRAASDLQSSVAPQMTNASRGSGPGRQALMREVVTTLLITIVLFLGLRYSAQAVPLDGPSMQPGLHTDERVLVNSLAYVFQQPARGDVIVFHPPNALSERYIKRVIGLPGDTVQLTPNDVYVNGVLLKEPYIAATPAGYTNNVEPETVQLGPGQYFVMGDNRTDSQDSRYFGPIAQSEIVGKAEFVVWPMNSIKGINTYPQTFAGIPTIQPLNQLH